MRVGILPHRDRAAALDLAGRAAAWLETHGAAPVIPGPEAELVGRPDLAADGAFPNGLDVVLSLGGDGTMLRTIDQVYEAGVAVLGVNVGQMGYLTEVEPADLDVALERLLADDYLVEERMMLALEVRSTGSAGRSATARRTPCSSAPPTTGTCSARTADCTRSGSTSTTRRPGYR